MIKNKKKKGFTLVELIVVIVIIGILAAVLVPSLTGYITKARRSNDVQIAGQLSRDIQYYCVENEIDQDKLIGTDIRTIAEFRGYDLKPRTDKWTFVYNQAKKLVEVKDFPLFEGDGTARKTGMPAEPTDPTNYEAGYFLLGKGNSTFEQAVNKLCNLSSLNDYEEAKSLVNNKALTHIEMFDPTTTLYVSNSATTYTSSESAISKIVYTEGTVSLPEQLSLTANLTLEESAKNIKSSIIKTIEPGSKFAEMYPKAKVINVALLKQVNLSMINESENSADFAKLSYIVSKDFVNAKKQVIDLFTIGKEEYKKLQDGYTYAISRKKCVITLYDENGAFARGETIIIFKDKLSSTTSE